jgi:glycosyltransferase involved in cell wall biosynthesis
MDLVIGKFVVDEYKNEILNKSHIIANGIDEFWLNNRVKEKENCNPKSINLLHVGAISKRKNIINTIKASEILIKQGYTIHFTAVGKIVNENIYDEFKKKNFTKYVSQLPKEELINIYRNNDILVVPSITETFGLVYPEAMSQGLPVVYTKDQGFDGQFAEGYVGYSVVWNNPDDIADKITRIINNYDNISKKCLENIEKFSWSTIKEKYKNIYTKLID